MNKDWLEWLAKTMSCRPEGNMYLDSERGLEIGKLCLDLAREDFSWHRIEPDVFWVDVQLFTKYKLEDDQIRFIDRQQPGTENYKTHAKERNAYAEMMRGYEKLKALAEESKQ